MQSTTYGEYRSPKGGGEEEAKIKNRINFWTGKLTKEINRMSRLLGLVEMWAYLVRIPGSDREFLEGMLTLVQESFSRGGFITDETEGDLLWRHIDQNKRIHDEFTFFGNVWPELWFICQVVDGCFMEFSHA